MRFVFLSRLFCASVFLLSGCITTQQQASVLNLNYAGNEPSTIKRDLKIGIVEPAYFGKSPMDRMGSMLALVGASRDAPVEIQVHNEYQKYVPRVRNSLTADLERILASKGFRIANKYASYDVIPYAEKRSIDLLLVPRFDFSPVVTDTSGAFMRRHNYVSGDIRVLGTMEIDLVEPLSREKIIIKKIDVTVPSDGAVKYSSVNGALNALVDLLNTVYPQLLSRASSLLDADEIEASSKDIQSLKEKNLLTH